MKKIKQTVVQFDLLAIPKRIIVQFVDAEGQELQQITEYSSLNDDEKVIFDSFEKLCIDHL